MRQEDYKIALELKQELAKFIELKDFRIYGSRARGDYEDDSDLDIFIEVKSLNQDLKKKIRHTAWEVGLKYLMVISARIFTQEQIEDSPLRASDLILNIMEEGVQV